MTENEIADLARAREALARQRNAIAKRMAMAEFAAVSAADDITRILGAIEAIDRVLNAEGRPYMSPHLSEPDGAGAGLSA